MAILSFKSKNWVLYHQSFTLEEDIVLMEVYASSELGQYFIPKAWKAKADCGTCQGPEEHSERRMKGIAQQD